MMKKLTAAAVLLAVSASSWAADQYLNTASAINQTKVATVDAGARQLFANTVRLKEGESRRETLDAQAGKAYTVFADCDTRCSDIDMVIRRNGEEVFKESGSGDAPEFSWLADSTGRYDIEVLMKACSGSRCRVQTQVFEGSKVLETASRSGAGNGAWLEVAHRINREKIQGIDAAAVEHPTHEHSLPEGEKHSQTVSLTAGRHYAFFADCDTNCSDIDMTLSRDGKDIVSLTDPSDAPEFSLRADESGEYRLTVAMEDCSAEKCAYSTQIFESGKDLDTSLHHAHLTNRRVVAEKDAGAREILLRNERLAEGQSLDFTLNLTAGKVYTFYGDCDVSCSDIDLTLSRNGREVKSDTMADSVPLFSWRANRSGIYNVSIPMKRCTAQNCAVSAHVFEGTRMVYDRD